MILDTTNIPSVPYECIFTVIRENRQKSAKLLNSALVFPRMMAEMQQQKASWYRGAGLGLLVFCVIVLVLAFISPHPTVLKIRSFLGLFGSWILPTETALALQLIFHRSAQTLSVTVVDPLSISLTVIKQALVYAFLGIIIHRCVKR